jgi:two-component system, response regulator / RNA-binding antiterminator
MKLRVMVVDESPERAAVLEQALRAQDYEVTASMATGQDLLGSVSRVRPDVIIIDTESPDRDTLEDMHVIHRDQPCPIVMFTHDGDSAKIREAIRAGVSAYIVDGLEPERIRPIIEVAIARFNQFQTLRNELNEVQTRLAERKLIERAKGILMQQRKVPEDQAYRLMRKMAMERNMRLADLARSMIAAAELLG